MPNEPTEPSPSPSRESAPPPSAAASSPASERASRSDTAAGFVADAGPEFDPEAAGAETPPLPPTPGQIAEDLVEWEEDAIDGLLGLQGRLLHAAVGVAQEDWLHTELDLAAITPPLTRICNRYEPVRRYAKHADPVTLASALFAYATRSLLERREVLAELAPADTEAIPPAEQPIAADVAPVPPPRAAGQFPTSPRAPAPPMQPTQGPAPVPSPRSGEAPIDPTAMAWEVEGG